MRFPDRIQVEATMDSMGNITARPKSDEYSKAFAEVQKENGGGGDLDCFFQEGMGATEFLENHVPKSLREDLYSGYDVSFEEDPWVVGHWYGYDAHTLCERFSEYY